MNVLALDTSGPVAGVAIKKDNVMAYDCAATNKMTHSVNLMPMIDEAFTHAGLTLADMDRIAVVVGPGSFTGVRIGVSTAKGLSHGANIPCVAVNALEAMACGIPYFDGIVCPVQDARAGQVYGAAFRTGETLERLMPDTPMKLEDYAAKIGEFGDRFCFVGDGAAVMREKLAALLGDKAFFPPCASSYLRAACVAELGSLADAEELDYLTLMPLYLRAPSAERNRALQEAMNAQA